MTEQLQALCDEIQWAFSRDDSIKSALTVKSFVRESVANQHWILAHLAPTPAAAAFVFAAFDTAPDAFREHHRLWEAACALATAFPRSILDTLRRPDRRHQDLAAACAAALCLSDAVPLLVHVVKNAPYMAAQKAAIRALGTMQAEEAVEDIGDFLYAGNRDLVVTAIEALGAIGTPDAVDKLRGRLGTDTGVDTLILRALARSEDPDAIATIVAVTADTCPQLRTFAKQLLVSLGEEVIPFVQSALSAADEDQAVHLLNVLAGIPCPRSAAVVRRYLGHALPSPNVRFAAYEALGDLPIVHGAAALVRGLEDPEEHVAVAAAHAIERNWNAMLERGLSNVLREDAALQRRCADILITAEAFTALADLCVQDAMRRAVVASAQTAPSELRARIADMLDDSGWRQDAAALRTSEVPRTSTKRRLVWAVDDSRMMLAIYKKALFQAQCDFRLFEFPRDVLALADNERPDLLITDLNMPEIDGLALTRKVRTTWGDTVPIVLITTQSSARDEAVDTHTEVTEILFKPFTQSQIEDVLQRLIG